MPQGCRELCNSAAYVEDCQLVNRIAIQFCLSASWLQSQRLVRSFSESCSEWFIRLVKMRARVRSLLWPNRLSNKFLAVVQYLQAILRYLIRQGSGQTSAAAFWRYRRRSETVMPSARSYAGFQGFFGQLVLTSIASSVQLRNEDTPG